MTPGCIKKAQGQPSRLCYIGHVLTDNRHALVVDAEPPQASGTAEVDVALAMLDRRPGARRLTVGADKNYDQHRFVQGARQANVTPHVTQNTNGRASTIDARTTRHRVETPFGWGKYARPLK